MYKITDYGMAISTFFPEKINVDARLSVFKASIDSLLLSKFDGQIFIIDDASFYKKHLEIIPKDSRVKIIEKIENGGYSRIKNTGLQHLINTGNKKFLLADDDVIYEDPYWFGPYLNALENSGIHYFTHYMYDHKETVKYNNYYVYKTATVNGYLQAIDSECIEKIGFFKILPYKIGHDHTNYVLRAIKANLTPFYSDVINSEKLLHHTADPATTRQGGDVPWNIQEKGNAGPAFDVDKNNLYCGSIE